MCGAGLLWNTETGQYKSLISISYISTYICLSSLQVSATGRPRWCVRVYQGDPGPPPNIIFKLVRSSDSGATTRTSWFSIIKRQKVLLTGSGSCCRPTFISTICHFSYVLPHYQSYRLDRAVHCLQFPELCYRFKRGITTRNKAMLCYLMEMFYCWQVLTRPGWSTGQGRVGLG